MDRVLFTITSLLLVPSLGCTSHHILPLAQPPLREGDRSSFGCLGDRRPRREVIFQDAKERVKELAVQVSGTEVPRSDEEEEGETERERARLVLMRLGWDSWT